MTPLYTEISWLLFSLITFVFTLYILNIFWIIFSRYLLFYLEDNSQLSELSYYFYIAQPRSSQTREEGVRFQI